MFTDTPLSKEELEDAFKELTSEPEAPKSVAVIRYLLRLPDSPKNTYIGDAIINFVIRVNKKVDYKGKRYKVTAVLHNIRISSNEIRHVLTVKEL